MTIFYIIFTLVINFLLISWFSRNQTDNILLLSVEQRKQSQLLFYVGLFNSVVASFMTYWFLEQVSTGHSQFNNLIVETSRITLIWSFSILFLVVGSSKLEFREKGIYLMLLSIPWHRVKSYYWDKSKSNIIKLQLSPSHPLSVGFKIIAVPTKDLEAVKQILNERL